MFKIFSNLKLQSYKGITYEQKARYYELLGKSYDQKNKAKMAFKYFNLANKIDFNHPENKKFDKDNTLKQIRINRKYFNKKNIKTWKKITQKSNQPKNYFLIGFPRSGTTLLDTILRTHSQGVFKEPLLLAFSGLYRVIYMFQTAGLHL